MYERELRNATDGYAPAVKIIRHSATEKGVTCFFAFPKETVPCLQISKKNHLGNQPARPRENNNYSVMQNFVAYEIFVQRKFPDIPYTGYDHEDMYMLTHGEYDYPLLKCFLHVCRSSSCPPWVQRTSLPR